MGKCPPGVFCIENATLVFICFIIFVLIVIVFYLNNNLPKIVKNTIINNSENEESGLYPRANYSFSNLENDVLLNPYEGPVRNNNLFRGTNIISSRIPVNIPTQSFNTDYRQIGILTRHGGNKEMILPLMGRPLITNRDKWNFYTISESNNMVKLPVTLNGKDCTNDLGCNDLYTGDIVKVAGYNDDFKVTTYQNDMPKYLPYI
tara:strand:- start:383 stop:994 length:612 start_codon:yes stop_codon:yes gene_type:complete